MSSWASRLRRGCCSLNDGLGQVQLMLWLVNWGFRSAMSLSAQARESALLPEHAAQI